MQRHSYIPARYICHHQKRKTHSGAFLRDQVIQIRTPAQPG